MNYSNEQRNDIRIGKRLARFETTDYMNVNRNKI